MKRIWGAVRSVHEVASVGYFAMWLVADHVRRKLTGRPSLMAETFQDLHFEIVESDIAKPYDSPGSGPPDRPHHKNGVRGGER